MEKKYLEVSFRGKKYGAFENVRNLVVNEDEGVITFTSDEGSFEYRKSANGLYSCEDNNIVFDEYNYCGRRALKRHVPAEYMTRGEIYNTNTPDESDVEQL